MHVKDKVCVVTGAASGIGEAVARAYAEAGARGVVIADLKTSRERLAKVAGDIDGLPITADVGLEEDIKALIAAAEDKYGPVDVFFSNAGLSRKGQESASDADWDVSWRVHVMSHVFAARALVPGMLARGSGYLLNTASAAGLLASLNSMPYGVTKNAAVALAEHLAIQYGDRGIRVSVLCPQSVQTGMTTPGPSAARVDGVLQPPEVARMVIEAMEAERFLILSHPQVAEYMQRKASSRDRWITGMRRLRDKIYGAPGYGLKLSGSDFVHPRRKRIQHFVQYLAVVAARAHQHMEGMIGLLHRMQRCQCTRPFDDRFKQTQFRERVACSLQEQHRDIDIREMLWHDRWTAFPLDAGESRERRARGHRPKAQSPAPATSCARRMICRPRSAATRHSSARPLPPRPARRRGRPPANRAACCLFPYKETDSATSRCRARQARQRSPPSTHASCRRRRHARTRNRPAPSRGRIRSAETGGAFAIAISSFCASAAFKTSKMPRIQLQVQGCHSSVRFQLCVGRA